MDLPGSIKDTLERERRSRTDLDHGEPAPGKREVDLYVRTYNTLLQSSGAISVSSLEPAHLTAAPSLHAGAKEIEPDLNALIYSVQRLPKCILQASDIVLGQTDDAFAQVRLRRYEHMVGRRRTWPTTQMALGRWADAGGADRFGV